VEERKGTSRTVKGELATTAVGLPMEDMGIITAVVRLFHEEENSQTPTI